MVVTRIMTAILQEENEVCIPWHLGQLAHWLKALFPAAVIDYINWFLGGFEAMRTCVGRKGELNPVNQLQAGKK